jgi:hypothetical protein
MERPPASPATLVASRAHSDHALHARAPWATHTEPDRSYRASWQLRAELDDRVCRGARQPLAWSWPASLAAGHS